MTPAEFAPLGGLAAAVYVIGCGLGYVLRRAASRDATASLATEPVRRTRAPRRLVEPRGGRKDNLKHIRGIGPRIERDLNELGVFHFDQVAAWDRQTIAWVESHFGFPGRIGREKWISKARELAGGTMPERKANAASSRVVEPLRP